MLNRFKKSVLLSAYSFLTLSLAYADGDWVYLIATEDLMR